MTRTHLIRVRVTEDELAQIRKAAKLRKLGLSEHVRDRAATITVSCGLEALAVREDARGALREMFASADYEKATRETWADLEYNEDAGADAAWDRYVAARDAYHAARAKAREVAK